MEHQGRWRWTRLASRTLVARTQETRRQAEDTVRRTRELQARLASLESKLREAVNRAVELKARQCPFVQPQLGSD